MCGVAGGDAEHAIIGGEKDVDGCMLGTREMESIVGAKPHRLQFLCTCDSGIRQRDRAVRSAEHIPDTRPSLGTGRIVNLFFHNGTTEPLPCTGLATSQDQEYRFGFQPYTVLALIVKGTVQATDIKVDTWHWC
jgi:hypothetical protein